jgi:GT2 family glycosyltransferase
LRRSATAAREPDEARVKVGVSVISTNEGELLRHALPTALMQEDVEVVVLDNASDDSTAQVAAELGVRCVRLPERHSFCRAMNAAVRAVEGDALLFMQPDCFLAPGFVAAARRHLEQQPDVGSVAPKLIRTEGPGEGQRLDALDTAGMVVDRRRKNGLVGHGRPALAFSARSEAFGADGAVALYRRTALEDAAVDGEVFDEDLVLVRDGVPADWGSDADLAWRTRMLGWRCVYEPEAVGYHIRRYSPSRRAEIAEWQRMVQFRNRYLMIVKNDPLAGLARDLPRILAYEVLALGFALLRERHLLRGYVEAARMLPRMHAKRVVLRRRRRTRGLGPVPYGLQPPD